MSFVSFVHCIDTEGPLYESSTATIERVQEIIGYQFPESPSVELIKRLKEGSVDLQGREEEVKNLLHSHRVKLNTDWYQLDEMLTELGKGEFREKYQDSEGRCWVFSWFCLDHIGYSDNPRRRDIGYHNIFDHYVEHCNSHNYDDDVYLHFHPMSRYREAHRCATSYSQSPHLYETFCRRLIDRNWFPSAFRAGFQAERPDSHLFLEQWIPFDYSNMSIENWDEIDKQSDFHLGRSGNWKGAPNSWKPYHPHIDDHRKVGNCRRWIARCLNAMNRIAPVTKEEIHKAFYDANKTGLPQIVGFCGHDFRDLRNEVEFLNRLIGDSASQFPSIKYYYDNANQAFQRYMKFFETKPNIPQLKINFYQELSDFPRIEVKLISGSVFGPQPFLAVRSPSRNYYHDNFDYFVDEQIWHYAFSPDSIDIDDVAEIAVGCVDGWGETSVVSLVRENPRCSVFKEKIS